VSGTHSLRRVDVVRVYPSDDDNIRILEIAAEQASLELWEQLLDDHNIEQAARSGIWRAVVDHLTSVKDAAYDVGFRRGRRGGTPVEATADTAQRGAPFTFRGPWFGAAEAAAYIPCRSLNAFYVWCHRHGIVRRANGSVAKADLDRVLSPRRRTVRRMAPASLANLRRGSDAKGGAR
jgi:hypothetical protein